MSFLDKIFEKKKEASLPSFVMGVKDIFPLVNSDNLVVTGSIKGTVHVGDAVYITNPGDDEGGMFVTTIDGIETGPKVSVNVAENCQVGLLINSGAKYNIRKASVLFTRDQSTKNVHDEYISALGDTYVSAQQLELSDQELEALSITDCAEIWRLFSWLHSQVYKDETEEKRQDNRKKIDRLAGVLCNKILQADAIYYVYNKITNEPHMFSRTIKQEDGSYMCTPPDIRIFTKAYESVMKNAYPEDRFEIRKVENGEKKDGIYNFLGSTFYLNGACGVEVLSQETAISAQMLVQEPDYSNVPVQNIPVTNPDLMRWMLLIGQLGKPQGEDGELIYRLYYGFMAREMGKAKFLIPMKHEGEMQKPDENGKVILQKDMQINFPTMKGKYDRQAVYMFTDWKRFRMVYTEEDWNSLVQPIDGMIGVFDCAINATNYPAAGCYIGKEMYEDMKKLWH